MSLWLRRKEFRAYIARGPSDGSGHVVGGRQLANPGVDSVRLARQRGGKSPAMSVSGIEYLIRKRQRAIEARKKKISKAIEKSRDKLDDDKVWAALLDEIMDLNNECLGLQMEIRGIKTAERIAGDNPDNPVRAVNDEIDDELRKAKELNRRLVELLQRVIQDIVTNPQKSQEEQAKADALQVQMDIELARIRGKYAVLDLLRYRDAHSGD